MESVFGLGHGASLSGAFLSSGRLLSKNDQRFQLSNTVASSQFALGRRSSETNAELKQVVRRASAKGKDKRAPKATLSLIGSVTGGSTYDFAVTYKDDKGIKAGSLGAGDILVTGNGFSQVATLVSKASSKKGKIYKVIYRVAAPGGTWDAAANGSYTISLRGKQVKDVSRNSAVAKPLGTFSVQLAAPPISKPPTALFNGDLFVEEPNSFYQFNVTYSDSDNAVSMASIDNNDILVTNSQGFSQLATKVSVSDGSDGTPRTVTYQINAPGGSWDTSENGSYDVTLQPNQVSDITGNFAATVPLGSFFVSIGQPPPDSENPKAKLNAASPWKDNNNAYTFTVTYTDNFAIDATSIDSNDITVTDNRGTPQQIELVAANGSPTSYTVTYQLKAPGGTWNRADNGSYDVIAQTNQVKDASGNAVDSSTLGILQVNIPLRSSTQSYSSNSDNKATDFVLDIDASSRIVRQFEFTYLDVSSGQGRDESGAIIPTVTRVEFGPANIKTASSFQELLSQEEAKDFADGFELYGDLFAPSSLRDSDLIYFAKLNNSYMVLPDGSFRTISSNLLVLGIKTSNLDGADPFTLLDLALNNLALNRGNADTTINSIVHSNSSEGFKIFGLK